MSSLYSLKVKMWSVHPYSPVNTSPGLEVITRPVSGSPRLKSAIQSGLSTRPSPGLDGEMGGEKETVLLLQSRSWSREGSKSGVSSSSIPQSLLKKHTQLSLNTVQNYIFMCTKHLHSGAQNRKILLQSSTMSSHGHTVSPDWKCLFLASQNFDLTNTNWGKRLSLSHWCISEHTYI